MNWDLISGSVFWFLLLIFQGRQWHQEKHVFKLGFGFFLPIWAGHNLYHSGLHQSKRISFYRPAWSGSLLARWVQLCIQLRFIFYVCVKSPAMNLAAQSHRPYSLFRARRHFHRLSLWQPGWAERTKAKNGLRNSWHKKKKWDSFSSSLHSTSQINTCRHNAPFTHLNWNNTFGQTLVLVSPFKWEKKKNKL